MKWIRSCLVAASTILIWSPGGQAADAPNYKLIQRIKVPDGGFDYATFDAAANKVYMPRGSFTTVIDPNTGAISQFAHGESNHIALPVPGTNLLVLTQGGKGIVRILDKTSDKVLADLPAGKNPNSAAYDPVTKLVFVMNKESGNTSVVDPNARKIVDTISISPNVLEFPVADGHGRIFDNVETTAEIAVIDARSRKLTTTYKMPGCERPSGLAYAPDSNLLISSCRNGTAKILQADSGKEVASIPIGAGPDAAIYDQRRKLAFIPCGGDGVMDIISLADAAHPTLVQKVETQAGSRTGTLDPNTGRVYLMASKPDPAAGGGRGAPRLAGSWEVLVFGP